LALEEQKWKKLANMKSKRWAAASVELDGKLFVTGGHNGQDLKSTEYISIEGDVAPGPDLPSPRDSHCMIKLPSGNVMVTGGNPSKKEVLMFDQTTNTFEKNSTSLSTERLGHGCAVFLSPHHGGRPVAMAAGGEYQATAEIWDYTEPNSVWTPGKISRFFFDFFISPLLKGRKILNDFLLVILVDSPIPTNYTTDFYGARAITSPSGNGVIVQKDEHLYEFTCKVESCAWTILPQKLKQSVWYATLLALPPGTGCD
jgi:hypothetical protein